MCLMFISYIEILTKNVTHSKVVLIPTFTHLISDELTNQSIHYIRLLKR